MSRISIALKAIAASIFAVGVALALTNPSHADTLRVMSGAAALASETVIGNDPPAGS